MYVVFYWLIGKKVGVSVGRKTGHVTVAAEDYSQFPESVHRLLSVESLKERRLCAWSVQAVLVSKTITIKKRNGKRKTFALHLEKSAEVNFSEGKIIVYRGRFIKLLNAPKPLRDQLIVELPTLNAFRTTEVATVQKEHIDLEHGDIEVFDSKKHKFFTVPLHPTVAIHLDEFIVQQGIKSGLLFRPGSKAGRRSEGPLTDVAIDYIWKKCCALARVPYMSPRYGRAYFAINWHIVQGKSLIGLMDILRHISLLATQRYLSKIRCYEDLKTEFYRGVRSPFSPLCARFEACPLATDGCYCHFYMPKIKVEA